MRLIRRFLPFSSVGGAALYAYRYRRPLWSWTEWLARSVPRIADGDGAEVLAEGRLRLRLRADERTAASDIDATVEDRRAVLRGVAEAPARAAAVELARRTKGVERVVDETTPPAKRRRGRFRLAA